MTPSFADRRHVRYREGIVVWLSPASTSATLLGVAASYHGDYTTSTSPATSDDHPLIKYYSEDDVLDHSCGFTDVVGGMQPLIAWDSLPTVAQEALADKDWGGQFFFHQLCNGSEVVC